MRYRLLSFILTLITGGALVSAPAFAAKKTIYIKPFAILKGLPRTDPSGNRVKDYISEVIVDDKDLSLTSDEEVREVMRQEETRMSLDACYDDACIKKLMESIRTDYIIYGTVSLEDEGYFITAKILDRTGGRVKLTRVKTLQFQDKRKIKMASLDLAAYLLDGKAVDMRRYDDDYQAVIEAYEKRVPKGLALAGAFFTPSKTPFSDYYDSLMGARLDYTHPIGHYFAVTGGLYYIQANDDSGEVTVSLNSYHIGGAAGYPLFGFAYPYVKLLGRVTWFSEKGPDDTAGFLGFGGEGAAGIAFIVWRGITLYGEYGMSIVKLNDKEKTDVSGALISAGLMYAFF